MGRTVLFVAACAGLGSACAAANSAKWTAVVVPTSTSTTLVQSDGVRRASPPSFFDNGTTDNGLPETSTSAMVAQEAPPIESTTTVTPTTTIDTTTTVPVTTSTAPGPPPGTRFELLPVGAVLPTEEDCAARVRRGQPEVRPENATFNATPGPTPNARYPRVTGNFTGTTDEIIQWAACKWGIDEDILRAQAVKESYWDQRNLGDWSTDPAGCVPGHPIGADGRPDECPQSAGILQVRAPFHIEAIDGALASTAYNVDYAMAAWRDCFEGGFGWFNDNERGADYAAGDAWGCVGSWFAGRWHTDPANGYIAAVQGILANREWEQPWFASSIG